ncbi:TPA: extracellular solute-binding protein [Clostridium botulinum]|nr:extracellular solute-binding protein [Clostridium botulinum]
MGWKKNKIIIIGIIIIALIVLGIYPMISKKSLRTVGLESNSGTLKIYTMQVGGENSPIFQGTINEFKKKYPKIIIKEVPISVDGNAYAKKLLSDTLAGDGPDIIYFNPENVNVRKLQKSGMLADLKPFIEKDKDFTGEDYNKNVMNAGVFNGKTTFVPLSYYVNSYITTKELLKNNNISLKDNMSQKEFMKSIDAYINSVKGDTKKTLFASPVSITNFIASSGIKLVDYENKKIYFHKPEFREVIENYKKIYNTSIKKEDIQSSSGEEGYAAIKEGSTLFSNDEFRELREMFQSESRIKGESKETEVVGNLPTYTGGDKVIAVAKECMAINANTKNKAAAYAFIKTALYSKLEVKDANIEYVPVSYIPTNKKAREDIKKQYVEIFVGKKTKFSNKGSDMVFEKLSEDMETYYNKITKNIEKTEVTDNTLEDLMMECLKPYFEDKSSYEAAIKVLENKVNLYINE